MGTKDAPGDFDCYAKAKPDEPMFTLLARDPEAPALVEEWARRAEQTGTDPAKVAEARRCAGAMRKWRLDEALRVWEEALRTAGGPERVVFEGEGKVGS